MGLYVNPGNRNFKYIRNSKYKDKSGLIAVINDTLNTDIHLSCISRPRRFGKTYAAQMLCAYYCYGCDSSSLFYDLKISEASGYRDHMNRYNVLYLDVASRFSAASLEKLSKYFQKAIVEELSEYFDLCHTGDLSKALAESVDKSGRQFIAIIDEWDAPVRAAQATEETMNDYLELLRTLFKSDITKTVFAGAYMTGILPIKKDGSQSAVSEFEEYDMIDPGLFVPYIGFTDNEVAEICADFGVSVDMMTEWYNGYSFRWKSADEPGEVSISIYNSNSVMQAARKKKFRSYWRKTSAPNVLPDYFNIGFDGLDIAAEKLLAGLDIPVNVTGFRNDLMSFESADDVLTMMIHFGYLSYDEETKTAHIPNYEIKEEFADMIHRVKSEHTVERIRECNQFLEDIIDLKTEEAAAYIEKLHMSETNPRLYNNEESLRSIVKLATFTFRDHYMKIEEMPGGAGFSDIVFIPYSYEKIYPALIIELKCGDSAESAVCQIHDRQYYAPFVDYIEEILFVGISYNKNDPIKKHSCVIEEMHVG